MQVGGLLRQPQATTKASTIMPVTYQKKALSWPSDLSPSATYSAEPPKIALATA